MVALVIAFAVAFGLGAMGWSLSEYLLHRFAGHGPSRLRKGAWWLPPNVLLLLFWEEHTAHHRDPMYFAPGWKKALTAVATVPVAGVLVASFTSFAVGLSFALGFSLTYVAYEWLHRRVHTHAPTNAYMGWMRRHHLQHHVSPKKNHGVTSGLWDRVFGTREAPAVVKLPRSITPAWLMDPATKEAKAEFSGEYVLVGR